MALMSIGIETYKGSETQHFFSEPQKRLVEAWAHGYHKLNDSAAHLGLAVGTVKHSGYTITSMMDEGPGTDRVAKAVAYSAQNGWIDPSSFPDSIERKLTEAETLALTLRVLGLSRKEVAVRLKTTEVEIANNLDAINRLIGTKDDNGAIAWAILKVLKKPQAVEAK